MIEFNILSVSEAPSPSTKAICCTRLRFLSTTSGSLFTISSFCTSGEERSRITAATILSFLITKTDKLYWLVSGAGVDFIAEYDYKSGDVSPIVVDTFPNGTVPGNDSGRVLNFDKRF